MHPGLCGGLDGATAGAPKCGDGALVRIGLARGFARPRELTIFGRKGPIEIIPGRLFLVEVREPGSWGREKESWWYVRSVVLDNAPQGAHAAPPHRARFATDTVIYSALVYVCMSNVASTMVRAFTCLREEKYRATIPIAKFYSRLQ